MRKGGDNMKNKTKKIFVLFFSMILFVMSICVPMKVDASSSYQQRYTYTLTKDLNVRTSDNSSSYKYGTLKKGTKLIVMSTNCKNGYAKVYPITYSSSSKCYKRYGQFAASLGRNLPVYILKSGISLDGDSHKIDMRMETIRDLDELPSKYFTPTK